MSAIGIATVGQSPRDDVVPQMRRIWGEEIPVVERGALDAFDSSDLDELVARGDTILVSRLRDGSEIRLDAHGAESLLQRAAEYLSEAGCDPIIILCTGSSPVTIPGVRTVLPRELYPRILRGLTRGPIGVMVPAATQQSAALELFGDHFERVVTAHASPYDFPRDRTAFFEAAARFRGSGVDLIGMNCLGYGEDMAAFVAEHSGIPCVPASSAVAHSVSLLADRDRFAGTEG